MDSYSYRPQTPNCMHTAHCTCDGSISRLCFNSVSVALARLALTAAFGCRWLCCSLRLGCPALGVGLCFRFIIPTFLCSPFADEDEAFAAVASASSSSELKYGSKATAPRSTRALEEADCFCKSCKSNSLGGSAFETSGVAFAAFSFLACGSCFGSSSTCWTWFRQTPASTLLCVQSASLYNGNGDRRPV